MSEDELKTELERLRNENAALKRGASTGIRLKVSEKGAVSIYGMGRFPLTLYICTSLICVEVPRIDFCSQHLPDSKNADFRIARFPRDFVEDTTCARRADRGAKSFAASVHSGA